MLTDCYFLGGGNGAQDREQKKKKNSSCVKVSTTGLAMVPGNSVPSPASDYSIEKFNCS